MRNGVKTGVGVAALSVAVASPAFAQMDFTATVIGATVGNAVARGQGQVACMPDPSGLIPLWGPKLDQLMERYATAAAAGEARDVRKLFAKDEGGGEWVSEGVIRARSEIGKADDGTAPAPGLERVAVVFGGDSWTARGLWKAAATEAHPEAFYMVDFRRTRGWGIWQIWRVRRYDAANAPSLPAPFCTFDDQVAGLW